MQSAGLIALLTLLWGTGSRAATAAHWQVAGTTYNSVAFVDLSSVTTEGESRSFTAMRVSGQPTKDRWVSVIQKLDANCTTGVFNDAGSTIEQVDGSLKRYPGFGASHGPASRGVFRDMFEIVCNGRSGLKTPDPKAWTRRNFRVGS